MIVDHYYSYIIVNSSKVMVNPVFIRPDDLSIEESAKTKVAV